MAADYPPPPVPARRLPPLAALVLTLVVAGITSGLGAWQLSRAHRKEALETLQQQRSTLPPLDGAQLARSADDLPAQLQRRVVLTGRWLPEFTVLLDNRPMDGRVGFEVVTPLRVEGGPTVVVQRGWVERDRVDPRRIPPFTTPDGVVTIHGRVAPTPSRWVQLGADEPGRIRQNLDLPALERDAGAPQRPLIVVEGPEDPATIDGLARHWAAPAVTAGRNYGYAFQWFAMAALAVGLYLWFQFLQPARAHARARTGSPS